MARLSVWITFLGFNERPDIVLALTQEALIEEVVIGSQRRRVQVPLLVGPDQAVKSIVEAHGLYRLSAAGGGTYREADRSRLVWLQPKMKQHDIGGDRLGLLAEADQGMPGDIVPPHVAEL